MSNISQGQGFKNAVSSRLLRSQIILKYFRIRLDQDDIKHSPGKRSGISLGIYCLGFLICLFVCFFLFLFGFFFVFFLGGFFFWERGGVGQVWYPVNKL